MARLTIALLVLLVLVLGGGAAFLANWNIPAPRAKVEKVIPADQLGK